MYTSAQWSIMMRWIRSGLMRCSHRLVSTKTYFRAYGFYTGECDCFPLSACLGKVEAEGVESVHHLVMAFHLGDCVWIGGQGTTLVHRIVQHLLHQFADLALQVTALLNVFWHCGDFLLILCLLQNVQRMATVIAFCSHEKGNVP